MPLERASTLAGLGLLIATAALGQTGVNPGETDLLEEPRIYSPYVERTATNQNFAEGVYWGDTHLHTRYSTDSGMIGNRARPNRKQVWPGW